MENFDWKSLVTSFDDRRDMIVLENHAEAVQFCVRQFLQLAKDAISDHNQFSVALSGGSTPNAIFTELGKASYRDSIDWNKVLFFWSDERNVPPNQPENNYFTAMQSGLANLPVPKENFIRMNADPGSDLEESALSYEKEITQHISGGKFDLMMLGMGEDGHTASLFPHTLGLNPKDERLVVANYVPQKNCWRMSLTFKCINSANQICIYIMGKNKAKILREVLLGDYEPENTPVQNVGTKSSKALLILDEDAASMLQAIPGW